MKKSNTRQIYPKPTKNGFLPLKTNRIKKVRDNESMVEWKHINWRKLERRVFKLQKRIYKASRRGDVKARSQTPEDVDEFLGSQVSIGSTGYTRQPG